MTFPSYLWHPVFVHFSVALLAVATGFYLLASMRRDAPLKKQWLTVAEWNLWTGSGFAIVTVLFGWLAFNTVSHDSDTVHDLMETHAILALFTSAGFGTLALWSVWHRRSGSYPSWLFTGLMLVCLGFLAETGLRGGDLVYGHGLAVNLPTTPSVASPPSSAVQSPMQEEKATQHPHHHHHDTDHQH